MATLFFSSQFAYNDSWRQGVETHDYTAPNRSFFVWLGYRFVRFLTFNRQDGLYSLLWQWMYYFNRDNATMLFSLLWVPLAGFALSLLLLVLVSLVASLIVAPITMLWPTFFAILSELGLFLGLYFGVILSYTCSVIVLLVAEIYALVSYFLDKKQWRKTATVTHFILSAVLEDGLDINRINNVANAISVIRGKEKKHCVYEIIDVVRRSGLMQTNVGAMKLAALIRAFAQLGVFDQYLALNQGVAVVEHIQLEDVVFTGHGRGDGDELFVRYDKVEIVHAPGGYQTRSRDAENVDRGEFYHNAYHIFKLEHLIDCILRATNETPIDTLAPHQCNAINLFVARVNQNENNHINAQIFGSRNNFQQAFHFPPAAIPAGNNLPCDHKHNAARRQQKSDSSLADQKRTCACEAIQLQDTQQAAQILAIFFRYHVLELPSHDQFSQALANLKFDNKLCSFLVRLSSAFIALIEHQDAPRTNPIEHQDAPHTDPIERQDAPRTDPIERQDAPRTAHSRQDRHAAAIVYLRSIASNRRINNHSDKQEKSNTVQLINMARCTSASHIETLRTSIFANKFGHYQQFKEWLCTLKQSTASKPALNQFDYSATEQKDEHQAYDNADKKNEKRHKHKLHT